MYKFGLKLWSTNRHYINEALRLYDAGTYSYIELFAVPGSFKEHGNNWKKLNIPYIIHAPHSYTGLNLSQKEDRIKNIKLAQESLQFADLLNADTIIFHPGKAGDINETITQIKLINDTRITIENKPYNAVHDSDICNGHSPHEIKQIIDETRVHFCLDIGHAICSANSQKQNYIDFIRQFLTLNPSMYHLSDGDSKSIYDCHYHIGAGTFNIQKIMSLIPINSTITIETTKNSPDNLNDCEQDIHAIKKQISLKNKKKNITFTSAKKTDIHNVFDLVNDSAVRQNSINQEPINWDTHASWFTQKLTNKDTIFYIIKTKTKDFVGYIRFDKDTNNPEEYKISLALHKRFRGYNLGAYVIWQATKKLHAKKIIAYIKDTNQASIKSFLKSGYVYSEQEDKNTKILTFVWTRA